MMNGLRRLRERRMTLVEAAAAVGVSRYQTVADWEQGRKHPRLRHQRKLCAVLGVTPDELLAALAEPAAAPPRGGQG
jgi:transcriptional regulator with XRE-family HTH domain